MTFRSILPAGAGKCRLTTGPTGEGQVRTAGTAAWAYRKEKGLSMPSLPRSAGRAHRAGDPWPGTPGDRAGPGNHGARPDRGLAGRADLGRPPRPWRPDADRAGPGGWLSVSRMTLRHALANLARRGLVTRTVGRKGGTFVAESKLEQDLTTLAGFSEQLRRHGMVAGARVLSAVERPAGPVAAAALELAEGAPLYEVRRVRLGDGRPIALEHSLFPADAFPGMLQCPARRVALRTARVPVRAAPLPRQGEPGAGHRRGQGGRGAGGQGGGGAHAGRANRLRRRGHAGRVRP